MQRDGHMPITKIDTTYHLPLTRETITATIVLISSLAAHLFCWTNILYSHDSTLVNQIDVGWQIGIGRYLNPIYVHLRGTAVSPLFVGVLATVYIGIAAVLVVRLLDLKGIPALALTGIAMSTYVAVSATNATFLHDSDVYSFSSLFAVMAVCLPVRWRNLLGYALGAVCVCISLGLYQSSIQVTVALALISLTKDALEAKAAKDVLKRGFALVAMILAGGILYAIGIVIAQHATGYSIIHTYHGIDTIGDYQGLEIAPLILKTYLVPFKKLFATPETLHASGIAIINIFLAIASLYALVRLALAAKLSKPQLALLVFLTLMLPFGINCVYLISKGLSSLLITYSYSFFYVWAAMLLDKLMRLHAPSPSSEEAADQQDEKRAKRAGYLGALVLCAGAIVLVCNVGFSNQLYLTKALEEQATISYLTRVEDRMEQVEGYIPGETPVVFAGSFYAVSAVWDHHDIKPKGITGFEGNLAITYFETYGQYFRNVLGCPINIADRETMIELIKTEQVTEMPVFPAPNSCALIDGVMVVRISDDLQKELDLHNAVKG